MPNVYPQSRAEDILRVRNYLAMIRRIRGIGMLIVPLRPVPLFHDEQALPDLVWSSLRFGYLSEDAE